jgi:pimeloyl-ACP methyl ester carboxylesterase
MQSGLEPPEPLVQAVEGASFDPSPPGNQGEPRRWWGNHLGEFRWQAELARLMVDPVYRGEGVPRGDGAPVVLIPGLFAGDGSLEVMANWLRRMGYDARGSGIVSNVDCSDRALDRLERRVGGIRGETGRKVALIGHSRGGHFAKALVNRHPDWFSASISMGAGLEAPFDVSVPLKGVLKVARGVFARTSDRIERNGCFTEQCRCKFTGDFTAPVPEDVPFTAIYSKGDGVVWWEACRADWATNIEVTGSHVGLAFNRKVYRAVAETLAEQTRVSRERTPREHPQAA